MSVNREHKDRLFKKIFGRPEHRDWTLSLYNAVNGTAYDDPSQIEFNTMEDTLYMGMKNDVSFVMDMQLNLYGHQSVEVGTLKLVGIDEETIYKTFKMLLEDKAE